jgi:hypothetical protein
MKSYILDLIDKIKPLRVGLLALGLLTGAFVPAAGTRPVLDGPELVQTLLLPALAPLVLLVLLLDTLMSRIMMSDKEGEERARYRMIIRTNLLVVLFMVLLWAPYFNALFK